MTSRSIIGALIGASLTIAALEPALTAGRESTQEPPSIDDVFKAYASGDREVVARSFTKSTHFVDSLKLNDPKPFERWLGPWNRTKAVLVIELANVALTRGPQWVVALTRAGLRYVLAAQADSKTAAEVATIDVLWHRIAVGLLMWSASPLLTEEHIAAVALAGKKSARTLEPHLVLVRAIAKERLCWNDRPTLELPGQELRALIEATGIRFEEDLDGPRRAVRRKQFEMHQACLRDAAAQFEAAEAFDGTRAEAIARGSFLLINQGRPREAVDKLASAKPSTDRFVMYWTALFQGRALSALGRAEQALAAYTRATDLFPGAQSASIGRGLELFHLRRSDEVDAVSQSVRATVAPDPWLEYFRADQRFVNQWLTELRAVLQ